MFDPGRGMDSPLEPLRVFEAAHRALRAAGPALLLADDLQWVDDLSLALCHYLVRGANASAQGLSLIAVGRPSPKVASFADSFADVLPPERLTRLELEPLSGDEALDLVKALAPALNADAARELAERSVGSPFWIEALVRSSGAEVEAGRLVISRLRGTGADARALLALLAVAARPIGLTDGARISDWPVGRAEQAARELISVGIVVESDGTLRLAHDLIRAASAREITDDRRRVLQRRFGDWLAELERSAGPPSPVKTKAAQ